MRTKIAMPAVVAAFLAVGATGSYAQGSITQDPGNMAPGNLTTGRLGPSAPLPATGGNSALETINPNTRRNAAGTTGSSGGTTVFHGTPRGYGSSSPIGPRQRASPLSRGGSP
jgi:hypothetical protein